MFSRHKAWEKEDKSRLGNKGPSYIPRERKYHSFFRFFYQVSP